MKTRIIWIIFGLGIIATSCGADKNYIELQSIDGEQVFRIDAEGVQLLPGSVIDTTILHELIRDQDYYSKNFSKVVLNTQDSASIVMKIIREEKGFENEFFISLFGEYRNKRMAKLYLFEMCQGVNYWRLVESAFSIRCDTATKTVNLDAVMVAMGFDGPGHIRFPHNERGGYDYDIDRYMIVRCEFRVDEDMLKYFF
ncbi:MAG: hypothetical protein KAT79_00305 [candidate division Zixibacteria bacterium]|nr:hypothetical protein [candidate division Zixibacteria bacterium]